jgi:hypothetical protein
MEDLSAEVDMSLHNEGAFDRWLRGVLAVLIVLSAPALESGEWAVQLFGTALLATAITGWCPIYTLLHVDTGPRAAKVGWDRRRGDRHA